MHIRKLRLFDFKNYHEANVVFSPAINCITGLNGAGKTNILDAIHYLALTRSAFNSVEKENIRHGSHVMMLQGEWELAGRTHQVSCSYQSGKPKSVRFDGKEYDRIADHIGRIPVVLITPYDTDLIRGGSEGRRKFIDNILCQSESAYLRDLIQYNHILRQRNALLKQASGHMPDRDLLEPLTNPLVTLGEKIHARRSEFIKEFLGDAEGHYAEISGEREAVEIRYRSDASAGLKAVFEQNLRKDVLLERTTAGIHRDDYKFIMDGHAVKKYGSQGQQKSFVLALKLAQFAYLSRTRATTPVILLDDIFDKLDRERIASLMRILASDRTGQVFITDAREKRMRELFEASHLEATYFIVRNGEIHETE